MIKKISFSPLEILFLGAIGNFLVSVPDSLFLFMFKLKVGPWGKKKKEKKNWFMYKQTVSSVRAWMLLGKQYFPRMKKNALQIKAPREKLTELRNSH